MNKQADALPRMLIVSNNVISHTRNNGKTILSFIDGTDKNSIRQLYFNGEKPSVAGYSYYQLTDTDVVRGIFKKANRGRIWNELPEANASQNIKTANGSVKRSSFFRIVRDMIWKGHWRSRKLDQWLEEFSPEVVFFVAGDSCFSYNIVRHIHKKYHSRLITYITDDYIMPRKKETFFDKVKRLRVRKRMLRCIKQSDEYFTISTMMQKTYEALTGKHSEIILNMTPSMYDPATQEKKTENGKLTMVYTGSLYYGRDEVLGAIADAAADYNRHTEETEKTIEIQVFSNTAPKENEKTVFERENCCSYCGSLAPEGLKRALNEADVLLFVESFDQDMQDKTRYSLSTKVPEYMSVRKPILAVGPKQIGSMDYLSDVAFCANTREEIQQALVKAVSDKALQMQLVDEATKKYEKNHNIQKQKQMFFAKCYGSRKEDHT